MPLSRNISGKTWKHRLPVLLLVIAAWGIYGASIGHEFLVNWDDNKYITGNEAIRGLTPEHVRTVFTSFYVGNYAPVHLLSYMLDYSFWGLNPAGFIITNILLHLGNALLLYWILVPMVGSAMGAFLGAALFLVHPVQVESVDWISQRKNLLSMFFFLLSWAGYIRFRSHRTMATYLLSLLAFVLALLSKSVAVIAPAIFLLSDICCAGDERRPGRLRALAPYLLAAAAVAVIAVISQRGDIGGGRTGYHGGAPLATFYTMIPVFARYLQLLVWPAGLSAVYDPPIKTAVDVQVALCALLVAVVVALCRYLYRRDRIMLFGVLFFGIALLPVSQIVPLVTLMNDRYLYFPMVGAAIVFGRGAVLCGPLLEGRWRVPIGGGIFLLLLTLAVVSYRRAEVWHDAVSLWGDAVQKTPSHKSGWFGLGNARQKGDDLNGAENAYLRALTIDPSYREVLDNLSYLYLSRGEFAKAASFLEKTVLAYPDHRDAIFNLGISRYLLQNFAAAEEALSRALALSPSSPENLLLLATVNLHLGRRDAAAGFYRRAVAAGSPSNDVLYGMGAYAALNGEPGKAVAYLQQATAAGYRDCVYWRHDPDLKEIRTVPAMQLLTDTVCGQGK